MIILYWKRNLRCLFAHGPFSKIFSLFLRFWRELFDTSRACLYLRLSDQFQCLSTLLFFSDCTTDMEKRHKDTKKRALEIVYGPKMGLAIAPFLYAGRSDVFCCLILWTVCSAKERLSNVFWCLFRYKEPLRLWEYLVSILIWGVLELFRIIERKRTRFTRLKMDAEQCSIFQCLLLFY